MMNFSSWHEIQTLKKAFGLMTRFILPVVLTYYLLHVGVFGSLDFKINGIGFLSMLSHYFFILVVTVVWAGVFAVLADFATGREMVLQLSSFRKGIRFIPLVVGSFLAAQLVHFLCFMVTGSDVLSIDQWRIVLTPAVSLFVAWHVLESLRYLDRRKAAAVSPLDVLIITLIAFAGFFIDRASEAAADGSFNKGALAFLVELIKAFILYYCFFVLARGADPRGKPAGEDGAEPQRTLIMINPVLPGHFFAVAYSVLRSYPMFFIILRAFTPKRYRIIELNRVLWADEYACPGALVAISCYTSNATLAYGIARKFRAAGSTVVMGGPHVGLFPQEALEFCDAVVIGPAEGVWEKIVGDYEKGTLSGVFQGSCSEADLGRLHQELLQAPPSVVADTLMVTRGCKFRCYFCTHSSILNTAPRPLEDMIALLNRIASYSKSVLFFDSNIFMEPAYTKELLRRMIPLKVRWSGCASIDVAQDDDLVALLKESGCVELMIGYEIAVGTKEKLKGKFALLNDYLSLSRKLRKAGIRIKAQFMFGFPTDGWRNLWDLWWFSHQLSPHVSALAYMSPIPGSAYYDDIVKQDRFVNLNWNNCSGHKLVCSHPVLKDPFLLKNCFTLIFSLFFMTTSRFGFFVLLLFLFGCWSSIR
ncbi:MAG: radical SAM protein [Candidatus Omnitrophica bacterium]|nr:radical SAM protein [Candidatus Omnitrophota bacterium]